MEIMTQCCGVVLLIVLFAFYSRQKTLPLSTSKAFVGAIIVTFICVCLDIASVIVIYNKDMIPDIIVEIICKAYLISLVGVGFCGFFYVCIDAVTQDVRYKTVLHISIAVAVIGVTIVAVLPIRYHVTATELYTYGPSVLMTYVFAVSYVIGNIIFVYVFKESMHPKRREAVRMWMILWIISALIQFLNNQWLIVGFCSCLGVVILYIKLENPEMNIDKSTGLFNQNALIQYMKQLYSKKQDISVVYVAFGELGKYTIAGHSSVSVDRQIVSFFEELSDAVVFKNVQDEIAVIYHDRAAAKKGLDVIQKRFEYGWGRDGDVVLKPVYIYIEDARIISSFEEFSRLIQYSVQNCLGIKKDNLIVVDSKVIDDIHHEIDVEKLLTDAIEKDWIEMFYQPIYATKSKCFTSAEALMRIRNQEGKIIPPGEIIDIAERNGMILKVGEIVFEKVCRFIKDKQPEKYGIKYIEVNLSVVQCSNEQLADSYLQIMKKYGVDPKMINLEITESASIAGKKILLENMRTLMDYGVRFSLDDFGTGQSNLNYIVDMPVDIVKFDRNMSNGYFENGKIRYVMNAAMHMIHGMQLDIVSEGIETQEQCKMMEDLGISYIQGYYFSKPLPADEFLEFLENQA